MSLSWDEAVAYALTLPDTALSTSYDAPAVKVASNGRAFLSRGQEAHEAFCLQIDRDMIDLLMATDPATFYQTPHYAGWDAVLVRYATDDPERVRAVIEQAHDRTVAKKAGAAASPQSVSRFSHFAAIDWSGAIGPRQPGIAVALCAPGRDAPALVRPGHLWSRQAVLDWMLREMPPGTLVGLDLGLAFPFLDRSAFFPLWTESPMDGRALWALVERICTDDPHLSASSFVDHVEASRYFRRHGGREGDLFGGGRGRLRLTEHAQQAQGLNPYSNLNLVGAAQVGKSSLTGMRLLHRAQQHLPIWPFDADPGTGSLIVEIYTSLAALAAGKRKGQTKIAADELDARLAAVGSDPHGPLTCRYSDHATDALLTAAWLRHAHDRPALWAPAGLTETVARTEGWTFGIA